MGSSIGSCSETKPNEIRSKKVDCKKTKAMAFIARCFLLNADGCFPIKKYLTNYTLKNISNPTVYSKIQRFADITKNLIMIGNIQRAKRCLNVADEIYKNGSAEIKNAIVNIYVFSVSTFLEIHHCNIKNLFPEALHSAYQKQVNAYGI